MPSNEAVEKVPKQGILTACENAPLSLVASNIAAVAHEDAIYEEIAALLTIDAQFNRARAHIASSSVDDRGGTFSTASTSVVSNAR